MPHDDGGANEFLETQAESERLREEIARKKRERTALVTKWQRKLKHGRKHDTDARKRWAEDRRVARGESLDSNRPWRVSANLIGAIIEVLQSFLYAKNPDISVRPSDSVARARIPAYRNYAHTLQIIISRMLKNAGLKRIGKQWVRKSMTVGISWVKAAMQTRLENDPMVEKELNDLQQQIARINTLTLRSKDESGEDGDTTRAEIESQMTALQARQELEVADGLVLDVMAPEDVIVSSEVGDIDNYLNAPWIAGDNYKDRDAVLEITGWTTKEDLTLLKTANIWMKRPRRGEEEDDITGVSTGDNWALMPISDTDDPETEMPDGFLRITEIWSKRDGVVYTLIDGINKKFAREPFAPRTGLRWYPFFGLGFHYVDGERYPQSDVRQLMPMQEEYNRARSNFSEHRERAIPGILFDKGAIADDSVTALEGSERQEYIGLDLSNPGTDMRTILTPKLYNPVDPALYDTEQIVVEMEKVSGQQEAIQSSVQVEKTATEARIQEGGRGARNDNRKDELEDILTELAEYVGQISAMLLDQADAEAYAGPEAVWIKMTTEQALRNFNIRVKAGSTGKPKALSDREIWSTLMPLIEGMIDRIGQARLMGAEWAAKPWIALLDETMRRLDDPAEIDKFLPVPPEPQQGDSEPTELEKSEIELNKSKAISERADVIEKVSELMTRRDAAEFLFGGAQAEPPPQQSQENEAPLEAPDPVLN